MYIDPKKVEIVKALDIDDLKDCPELYSAIMDMKLEGVESFHPKNYHLVSAGGESFVLKTKYLRSLYKNTPVRGKRIPVKLDWDSNVLRCGYANLNLIHQDTLEQVREYKDLYGNLCARVFKHQKGLVHIRYTCYEPRIIGCFYNTGRPYDFKEDTLQSIHEKEMGIFLKDKHNAWAEKHIKPLCKVEIEEFKSYPLVVMPKGTQWLGVYKKLKKGESVVLHQEQTCYNCTGPSWSHSHWQELTAVIKITL